LRLSLVYRWQCILALVAIGAASSKAAISPVVYDTDTSLSKWDAINSALVMDGTPGVTTHLNMNGCLIGQLGAYDTSLTSVSGGALFNLNAHDSSRTCVDDGGVVDCADLYDSSALTLGCGNLMDIRLYGSSVLTSNGGGSDSVYLKGASTFTLNSGSCDTVSSYDNSTVNVTGGTVSGINAFDNCMINLSGGFIGGIGGGSTTTVNIYGYGFSYTMSDADKLWPVLSGFWGDGTHFCMSIDTSKQNVIMHELIVPEPATLLLLGLGGLAARSAKLKTKS
jgi:hypothetical protein